MASQPNFPGGWVVTASNLQAIEPATALAPTLIVDGSQPFDLAVDVAGTGVFWILLEAFGFGFTVDYYAERFGVEPAVPPAGEQDLGQVAVVMAAGGSPYTLPATTLNIPANTLAAGVYRIMCMVRWGVGITAFPEEELLIEVYY